MRNKIKKIITENDVLIIAIISLILSITFFAYFYDLGLIISYGDARAHLNIARRVTDNLTPGLSQLGGVWLPLLHVLMLPTVWIDFMWHSGLSGSIVSMASYIIFLIYLYKSIYEITNSRLMSLIGWAVAAFNINLLYLQATPMTEALFICTLIIAIYYLILWRRSQSIFHLVISAFFLFLTSFNRYEGWSVVLLGVIVMGIISIGKGGWKYAEGRLILFSVVAFLGVFLWFVWQTAIFGDPIYFLSSDFSAKGQTLLSIESGDVPTFHNLIVSFLTAFYSQVHVNGLFSVVISIAGILFVLFYVIYRRDKEVFFKYLPLAIFFGPFFFLILALYRGNIPMTIPEFADGREFFNVRYALYSLPAIAIFFSVFPVKNFIFKFLLMVVVVINSISLFWLLPTLQTATLIDAGAKSVGQVEELNTWFAENYDGGLILASAATSDPIIFGTGLDMKQFITEGSNKFWHDSMEKPSKYAKWAIIAESKRDMVDRYVDHVQFGKNFILIREYAGFRIYKRKSDA